MYMELLRWTMRTTCSLATTLTLLAQAEDRCTKYARATSFRFCRNGYVDAWTFTPFFLASPTFLLLIPLLTQSQEYKQIKQIQRALVIAGAKRVHLTSVCLPPDNITNVLPTSVQ